MSDITKLPKWAQEHIRTVERERDSARRELDELKGGSLVNAERQKFFVDQFLGSPYWLPQYGRFGFKQDPTSDRNMPDFTIKESEEGVGGIEVSYSGNGRLIVVPRASNVMTISSIER